jgi:hypothetical protein
MTQSTRHGSVQDVMPLETSSKGRCPPGGEYGAVARHEAPVVEGPEAGPPSQLSLRSGVARGVGRDARQVPQLGVLTGPSRGPRSVEQVSTHHRGWLHRLNPRWDLIRR